MTAKLTGWYTPGQRPARSGVYRTRPLLAGPVYWQRFDRKLGMWFAFCHTAAHAAKQARPSAHQYPAWQGRTEK